MLVSNHMDFKDRHDLWVRSFKINGTQYWTRSGTLWNSIQKRTNPKSKAVSNNPSYLNVVNSFKDFQEFAEWCQEQTGYLSKEDNGRFWSIDKDLIGSKVYSTQNCVFVPNEINNAFHLNKDPNKNFPLGVCWYPRYSKFSSQCGRGITLGYFNSPEEAHAKWQERKILMFIKTLDNFTGKIDNRVSELIGSCIDQLHNDVANGLLTKSWSCMEKY